MPRNKRAEDHGKWPGGVGARGSANGIAPRRILITADPIGGVWTYTIDLMEALQSRGIAFALATMGRTLSPAQREAIKRLPHVSLFESGNKLEWMQDPWAEVDRAGEWLLEIAEDFHPDLVHLNGYAHGNLPWRRPVVMVAHSCVYSWFSAVRKTAPCPTEWGEYRRRVALGLRAATLVTAPTRAMLEELPKHYGGGFRLAAPVFNGRPAQGFTPGVKEPFILSGGRLWDEAKNVAVLARASPTLPWPVCLAGEGEHPDGSAVSFPNVNLLGCLAPDAFAEVLSRASIYALPARYEPFGLSALEAALSGCALVLGDIASLREVWGDAAIFVEPEDSNAWGAAINRLISSPSLRREMAARASERAAEFTLEEMGRKYHDLYITAMELHFRRPGVGAAVRGPRPGGAPRPLSIGPLGKSK
jgi:glycogen synthase